MTLGYEKDPLGFCQKCRRQRPVAAVGDRTLCADCLGAREPSAPRRLIPFEWGEVPRVLQIAVGQVMWRVPFVELQASKTRAVLYLPEGYADTVLASAGWSYRGISTHSGRDLQRWRLKAPSEEAAE